MRMLVMNIWVVGMLMSDGGMTVPMHMWLSYIHSNIMLMLVVLIMGVCMRVFKWFVCVFMFVSLCQMKPHAQTHQN